MKNSGVGASFLAEVAAATHWQPVNDPGIRGRHSIVAAANGVSEVAHHFGNEMSTSQSHILQPH